MVRISPCVNLYWSRWTFAMADPNPLFWISTSTVRISE